MKRFLVAAEQARHLQRPLEVALGVGFQLEAGFLDGRLLAHAGEHVLQFSPLWRVIENVAERQHRDIVAGGESGDCNEAAAVVAMVKAGHAEPNVTGKGFGEGCECFF